MPLQEFPGATPEQDKALRKIVARIGGGFLKVISVGPGWYDIVIGLDSALSEIYPTYVLYQVKEKFGTLRYYTEVDGNSSVRNLIEFFEILALETCEECGSMDGVTTGATAGSFMVQTLCATHRALDEEHYLSVNLAREAESDAPTS